ncbi:hypothetical protein Tco_0959857 [Tanacetum coccineum]
MSIRPQAPAPFLSEEDAGRFLALPTLPLSPLSPYSSLLPHIPSLSLPIPSPPPNSPTYREAPLGFRAVGTRQRDTPPYPVHETKIPEICLPLCKKPCRTAPTPGYEVGESLAAGAARQDGPADDLVGSIEEITPTTLEGVNQRVTDLSTIVEQKTTIMYGMMEDAQDDRSLLRARVNLLYKDRPVHRRLAVMIKREARMACKRALISELQSADHKRQGDYTSVSIPVEDDSNMGPPGVDEPPLLDYVPGPEELEQAPPSPVYLPYVPKPVNPEYIPPEDDVFPAEEQPLSVATSPTADSPRYIPESDPKRDLEEDDEEDPEEDSADYPADR